MTMVRFLSSPAEPIPSPVFICGCQRSGTTLLASLLGKRIPAIVTPESRFFSELLARASPDEHGFDPISSLTFIRRHWRFRIWDIDTDVTSHEDWLRQANSPRDLILRLVRLYGSAQGNGEAAYWIDHTPENVRHGKTLSAAFPDGRFIHIVRDGRAVAHSVSRLPWGPVNVGEAASWWTNRVGFGLALESALGPRATRVRFEDLIRDADAVLLRLTTFIGLSEVPEPRGGKGFVVPEYTRAQHELVNQPPQADRIDAWRTEMAEAEVDWFQRDTHDFLAYLGYELLPRSTGGSAIRKRWMARFVHSPIRRLNRRIWRLTRRVRT